jgi:hypothetical protein
VQQRAGRVTRRLQRRCPPGAGRARREQSGQLSQSRERVRPCSCPPEVATHEWADILGTFCSSWLRKRRPDNDQPVCSYGFPQ